ncbi:hypothetical protein GCM10020000_83160 [Streptomyces olivoverticillatus]
MSQDPERSRSAPSAIAWLPEAQALVTARLGPRVPRSMVTSATDALGRLRVRVIGETRSG